MSSAPSSPHHNMELTHGSLFSGIGGFDLGFERVGIKTLWQVECDPYALKVLEKHWPDVPRYTDIRAVEWGTVPRPDIVSGGFPCQDISEAGHGDGLAGARSGLWRFMAMVVSQIRPRYVVVENVSALLYRGLGRVLGDLSEIGYDAEWEIISACALGAPHTRERVFIVAYPQSERGLQLRWLQQPKNRQKKGYICQWPHQPEPVRMADGIPNRIHRLKCLGNAIVPQVAEEIGRMIMVVETEGGPTTG